MTSSPRIPKAEIDRPLRQPGEDASAGRMLGEVPESLGVMWHNRDVLKPSAAWAGRPRSGTRATRT